MTAHATTDHETIGTVRIGGRFQGPTGSGQGGWTAQRFTAFIDPDGGPVTTAIRAPVPLETDLSVVRRADRWELVAPDGLVIMVATRWDPDFPTTDPVTIADARRARSAFADTVAEHPVPWCFSCGVQHDSMNVHAGPLGDGRFATDWTVPDWAVLADGSVDRGAAWAAIDCCAAWWVGFSREPRIAPTVQYAVDEVQPIEPGATYALVAWAGDHDPEWDGRKRRAASAAFDDTGRLVARSVSMWVSVS